MLFSNFAALFTRGKHKRWVRRVVLFDITQLHRTGFATKPTLVSAVKWDVD